MKYENFEDSSTDTMYNMDGYLYGPKTIKGAYSALQKKVEKITGNKNLIGDVCDPIKSKNDILFLAKHACNTKDDVTGERMVSIIREDYIYLYYIHPEFNYCYRMTIELLDEETSFWYIDFALSKEA